MRYAVYNKGIREITANNTISLNNPYSTARVGNFTLSDFIGTTNERRLYLVYFNSSSKSNDSIKMEYHKVTENAIRMQDVHSFETVASSVGELEIASDMTFLAYSSPTSYNYGILNFGKLNSDGTFDNNCQIDLYGNPGETFIGVEISENNDIVYSNAKDDKFFAFTIGDWNNPQNWQPPQTFSPIPDHVEYTNSQIERSHKWERYYVVKSDGELRYFTSSLMD